MPLIISSCQPNGNSDNENIEFNYKVHEDAKTFIKVSELTASKVTKTRVNIIGKITNTSSRQIDWIAFDLVLIKDDKIVEVSKGFYPCNTTGSYGLMGLESCYFETTNYETSLFDSYRVEISRAKFK